MDKKDELQAVANEQTKKDFGSAAPQVIVPKSPIQLECAVCHNVDTVEGVLGRTHNPGSCGHCGGAFRVVKR